MLELRDLSIALEHRLSGDAVLTNRDLNTMQPDQSLEDTGPRRGSQLIRGGQDRWCGQANSWLPLRSDSGGRRSLSPRSRSRLARSGRIHLGHLARTGTGAGIGCFCALNPTTRIGDPDPGWGNAVGRFQLCRLTHTGTCGRCRGLRRVQPTKNRRQRWGDHRAPFGLEISIDLAPLQAAAGERVCGSSDHEPAQRERLLSTQGRPPGGG